MEKVFAIFPQNGKNVSTVWKIVAAKTGGDLAQRAGQAFQQAFAKMASLRLPSPF
jgi:hypothetical protein